MTEHPGAGAAPARGPVTARPQRPSRKIGMGPGSLVYIGDEISGIVDVELYHCTEGSELERHGLREVEELTAYRDAPGTTWVDVNGVHDVALIGRIGEIFGLHPLLLEDVVNANQRPKFEQHGEHLFLVVKMLLNSVTDEEIEEEQVSIVLGPGYVITYPGPSTMLTCSSSISSSVTLFSSILTTRNRCSPCCSNLGRWFALTTSSRSRGCRPKISPIRPIRATSWTPFTSTQVVPGASR